MKKYMLVPQSSSLPSPLTRKLSELDEEMKSILDKQDIGDYTKASMYQNILTKYLDVKSQLSQPQSIPIVEQTLQPTRNTTKINIDMFPKQYQNKARNLLNHIENEPSLGWNDRGEVQIRGEPINGSHIIDVVSDLVRPKRKNAESPTGMTDVIDALRQSNVPMSLISNKERFHTQPTSLDDSTTFLVTPRSSTPKRKGKAAKVKKIRWQNYQ